MAGHRATLKKNKKAFKSGHATKRSIKAANKGKVEKSGSGAGSGPKTHRVQSKSDRKNNANQLKQKKIEKSLRERALFADGKIERSVVFVPLIKNVSPQEIAVQVVDSPEVDSFEGIGVRSVRIDRFKAQIKVVLPDMDDFIGVLDACKVADFVVFGLSAVEEVDPAHGEQLIRAIEAQGVASTYCVVTDVVKSYPGKRNLQQDVIKSLSSYYGHFFPNFDKLYTTEKPQDGANLLRNLCQKLPKSIHWRDDRGYMIADAVHTEEKPGSTDADVGFLVVEGTVRGTGFNANDLVYIQGVGDFQVAKIEKAFRNEVTTFPADAPESLSPYVEEADNAEAGVDDEMDDDDDDDDDGYYYDDDDDDDFQDEFDLVKRNIDEELKPKDLPKGISETQAKWMKEDELERLRMERGVETNEADDDEMDATGFGGDEDDDDEEDEDDDDMNVDLSPEDEQKQFKEFQKRAHDELEFPDEIELTPEERATERLARYRGVKSLSNCVWDYDEEDSRRPEEWDRYLRIKGYRSTKAKVLKDFKRSVQVVAGDKCRIYVEVPASALAQLCDPSSKPFVLYELLPREHKLSVCQFAVSTWESYDVPIKSKDRLIVQYGARRVEIEPLFSQPTHNPNNVGRFLRYLQNGISGLATAVVPISFTNSPALFYKEKPDGSVELMADGTFLNSDYTRIIAKRAVLTGEVFHIHKSVVTVRYMFFHYEDVLAYQNVPLFTKMGRYGLIKDKIGTHGYYKATFDGTLNAQDIVAMALYKRLWPRQV